MAVRVRLRARRMLAASPSRTKEHYAGRERPSSKLRRLATWHPHATSAWRWPHRNWDRLRAGVEIARLRPAEAADADRWGRRARALRLCPFASWEDRWCAPGPR